MKAGENCLESAISVMRLALGYERPLPKQWRMPYSCMQLSEFLIDCFPNRNVISVISLDKAGYERMHLNPHLADEDINPDEYLVAFVYGVGESDQHVVIGTPAGFYTDEVKMVFGVSLDFAQSLGGGREHDG